jgi:hypothetical protein
LVSQRIAVHLPELGVVQRLKHIAGQIAALAASSRHDQSLMITMPGRRNPPCPASLHSFAAWSFVWVGATAWRKAKRLGASRPTWRSCRTSCSADPGGKVVATLLARRAGWADPEQEGLPGNISGQRKINTSNGNLLSVEEKHD